MTLAAGRASIATAVVSSAHGLDLGGDAVGERLGLGQERVVARGEVDQPGAGAGAAALQLGGDGEVLGAHEVRRGFSFQAICRGAWANGIAD
jgi:hypothetical protein